MLHQLHPPPAPPPAPPIPGTNIEITEKEVIKEDKQGKVTETIEITESVITEPVPESPPPPPPPPPLPPVAITVTTITDAKNDNVAETKEVYIQKETTVSESQEASTSAVITAYASVGGK